MSKEDIIGTVFPAAEERLKDALGKDIKIECDWESFENATNPEVAMQALFSFEGFFVSGRVASCIEYWCKWGAKDFIAEKLDVVKIQNLNEELSREDMNDLVSLDKTDEGVNTLIVKGNYSMGALGGFTKRCLSWKLASATGASAKKHRDNVVNYWIPEFVDDIKSRLEVPMNIEVEVDFESFETAHDENDAWNGFDSYYSFRETAWGFYDATRYYEPKILPTEIFEHIRKVVFHHVPGRDRSAKYAEVQDGTLHVHGVWELGGWRGCVDEYDIARVIRHHVILNRDEAQDEDDVVLKGKKFQNMNEKAQRFKMQLLQEAADTDVVRAGHVDYLKWMLSHDCFYQPTEEEFTKIDAAWKKIEKDCAEPNDAETGKRRKDAIEGCEEGERFVRGWVLAKINHRGTEQERILVATDKALYTLAWDAKKNELVSSKSTNRYELSEYWVGRVGTLKDSSGGGGSGAMAAASAVASALAKDRWAIEISTTIKNSSGLDPKAKIKAEITKKCLPFLRETVIEEKLGATEFGQKPLELPGLPKQSAGDIIEIAARSIYKEGGAPPTVTVNGSEAGLLDVLAILQVSLDDLAKQPTVKLSNAPSMTAPQVLSSVISVLEENADNLDLGIEPGGSINLLEIIAKMVKIIKIQQDKTGAGLELPKPTPLGLSEILKEIKKAMDAVEGAEYPAMYIKGLDLPQLPALLEELIPQIEANEQTIEFEKFPPLNFLGTLEKVTSALAKVPFPSVPLPDLPLPSLNVSLPGALGKAVSVYKSQVGEKPYYKEMQFEIKTPEEWGDHQSKSLSYEILYTVWGCANAANSPYWTSRPYSTGHIWYSSTTMGKLLGKIRG